MQLFWFDWSHYLLGFVSAYIASVCYVIISWFSEPFWRNIVLGVVYNILWCLVKSTFDDIRGGLEGIRILLYQWGTVSKQHVCHLTETH